MAIMGGKTNALTFRGPKTTLSCFVLLCVIGTHMGFLAASITLTVHPSSNVEMNQLVTIQCSFSQMEVVAYFYSSVNPSVPFCSLEPSGGVCKQTQCAEQYSTACPNTTTYRVQYPIPFNWNGASVYCKGLIANKEESDNVTFNIIVPVAEVILTPTQTVVNVSEQMKLTCKTDYCLPAANISWYKNSEIITSQVMTKTETNRTNGLVKTTSDLQYTGVAGDNGQQVYCRASNKPGAHVESNKYNLNVRYPPSSNPTITASPRGLQYDNGTRVNLICQLSGGNPVATLSWRCKGISMTGTNQSNPSKAVSQLQLIMDSSYNKQQCICAASHPVLNKPKSANVTFSVKVLVTEVILTPTQIAVNVDEQIKLTCKTDYCNPAASITWYKNSDVITSNIMSKTETNRTNGLVKTISDLQYTGVAGDNGQQMYCRASNKPGAHVESNKYNLNVRYPPSSNPVITAIPYGLQYDNGTHVTLTCQLFGGNPVATLSWRCRGMNMTGTNQSNSNTAVSVLQLVMDSSYNNEKCNCGASHPLLNDLKTSGQTFTVFYNNVITSNWNERYSINEHERFQLVCEVDGNPLSNITWVFVRNDSVIRKVHNVKNSSLEISSANCLDYGTYEVLADNGKGSVATKTANLTVNCKPRLYSTDSLTPVKIGIGNNDSLQIFVRILLFPPAIQTTWNFSRKTDDSKVIRDSIDGYSIKHVNGDVEQNTTLYKKTVNTEEFGNYTLTVENEVGIFTRMYHVDSARSPLIPTNITLLCENSMSIKISWISNFNGGDDQSFQISYSTNGYLTATHKILKTNIDDKGNGRPHSYIPSIELEGPIWFTLTASNKFGNTTSDPIYCNAVKESEDSPSNLPMIAGAAIGGLVFAGLVILGIVFFLRTMNESKGKKKGIHKRNEERESDEDDGLKENALYISAGPKDDEKPGVSGTAVYAEVNKKGPASDSNANVYAEVQKSGKAASDKVALYSDTTKPKKGLLKKEEKPKQKKAKKMKQKKEVADVYENAEDIAMTQNLDNVYSNTTESNGTKSENHGYKNQDGLLYVEVQFDQKQEIGKPVIHGEDEKTDYATVEFPFPPSSNNDKPRDEK